MFVVVSSFNLRSVLWWFWFLIASIACYYSTGVLLGTLYCACGYINKPCAHVNYRFSPALNLMKWAIFKCCTVILLFWFGVTLFIFSGVSSIMLWHDIQSLTDSHIVYCCHFASLILSAPFISATFLSNLHRLCEKSLMGITHLELMKSVELIHSCCNCKFQLLASCH